MIILGIKKCIWPIVHKWRKLVYPVKLWKYEQQLLVKYTINGINPLDRTLIFMQDINFSQGGLVDRVKGIVSASFLANKFKFKFKVYFMDSNDPLINFLCGKSIEIITDKSKLNFDKHFSQPVVWYNYIPGNQALIEKRLLSKNEIHLYCNMNLVQIFKNSELELQTVWSSIFNKIFSFPPSNLENSLGIHLRFIGLLGDFKDLRTHELSCKDKLEMIAWCENIILEIGKAHPGLLLLIVSDSSTFLKSLLEKEKFNSIKHRFQIDSSNIGHTALSSDDDIFKKTVSDFMDLRSCNKVIQVRYGKMHKSDFSRYAAMSSLKQFELIEYNGN